MRATSGRVHGPEVGDDGERLERCLGEPTFDGPLDEACARGCLATCRPEGVAAGHQLQHDAAPPFGIALAQEVQGRFDPRFVLLGRGGQLG